MKIDCGNERAGFWWSFSEDLVAAAKMIAENSDRIKFQGIYAHCGNSYKSKSTGEVILVSICFQIILKTNFRVEASHFNFRKQFRAVTSPLPGCERCLRSLRSRVGSRWARSERDQRPPVAKTARTSGRS